MEIEKIETLVIDFTKPKGQHYCVNGKYIDNRNIKLINIHIEQGIVSIEIDTKTYMRIQ